MSADDIDGQPLMAAILSPDLLQSIATYNLPLLPATSSASNPARSKVPYYVPVDHPGGGTQGTNPV